MENHELTPEEIERLTREVIMQAIKDSGIEGSFNYNNTPLNTEPFNSLNDKNSEGGKEAQAALWTMFEKEMQAKGAAKPVYTSSGGSASKKARQGTEKKKAKVIYASPSSKPAYIWEPIKGIGTENPATVTTYETFTPESRNSNVAKPESTSSNFEKYVKKVLNTEKGYVNRKSDRGGATNRGITIGTFQEFAKKDLGIEPTLDNLKKITAEQAKTIYKKEYWGTIKGDLIKNGSLASAIFDFNVNSGWHAINVLQKTLNGMGADLKEGKKMNQATLDALNKADPKKLFNAYLQARKDFLDNVVIKKYPSQEVNRKGWFNRINSIIFEH